MKLEEFTCKKCGCGLEANGDGFYKCPACATEYMREDVEKYKKELQDMFGQEKAERLANLRQMLWAATHEEYISSEQILSVCKDIKKIVPDDFSANFYEVANGGNSKDVTAFLKRIDVVRFADHVDDVIDFMIRSLRSEYLYAVNQLVERAYKRTDLDKYNEKTSKLAEEVKKVEEGVYNLDLPRDVFIAYSSRDMDCCGRDYVDELTQFLEAQGLSCFVALRNLQHGRGAVENYQSALNKAMNNSKVFVFISSKYSRNPGCDAMKREIPYIKKKDIENAPFGFKNDYEGMPLKYKKPRVEYRIDDIHNRATDGVLKEFFGTLEYAYTPEDVAERVGKYLHGDWAPVEETFFSPDWDDKLQERIDSIGEVTLESGELLEEIRAHYEMLPEERKKDIFVSKLAAAERIYRELRAVDNVESKINALKEKKFVYRESDAIKEVEEDFSELGKIDGGKKLQGKVQGKEYLKELVNGLKLINEFNASVEKIGNVTIGSGEQIEDAKTKYAALSDELRKYVNNSSTKLEKAAEDFSVLKKVTGIEQYIQAAQEKENLDDCLTAIDDLENQIACLSDRERKKINGLDAFKGFCAFCRKCEEVQKAIDGIGEVELEKKGLIEGVRKKYNNLSAEQKRKVDVQPLSEAEEELESLRNEASAVAKQKAKAKRVDELITRIGTNLTMKSLRNIRAAEKAYDALTPDEVKWVKLKKDLEKARKSYKEMKKFKRERRVRRLLGFLGFLLFVASVAVFGLLVYELYQQGLEPVSAEGFFGGGFVKPAVCAVAFLFAFIGAVRVMSRKRVKALIFELVWIIALVGSAYYVALDNRTIRETHLAPLGSNVRFCVSEDGQKDFEKDIYFLEYYEVDVPEKTGHRFLGYYDDKSAGEQYVASDGKALKPWLTLKGETKYLYARWEMIQVAVNFVDTDGSVIASQTTDYTKAYKVEELAAPEKEGYIFLGWSYDGARIDVPMYEFTPEKATYEVRAVWVDEEHAYPHTLTIKYLFADGSQAFDPYVNETDFYWESSYSVSSPQLEGYEPDKESVAGVMPNSELTVTVIYRKTYTVTVNYVMSDGSTPPECFTAVYVEGTEYSVTSPALDGYTADKTAVSGTLTEDVTETVTYTPELHTISYDLNTSGLGETPTFSFETTQIVYNAETYLPTPTAKEYTFVGWYYSPDCNDGAAVSGNGGIPYSDVTGYLKDGKWVIRKDVMLYAKWTSVQYTITYEPNGGRVAGSNYTTTFGKGDEIVIPMCEYSKYSEFNYFRGWYMDVGFKTALNVSALKASPKDVTLYAKWDLAVCYKSVLETPSSIGAIGINNRFIVDWSNETNLVGKQIEVTNTVKEIAFVGSANKTFTDTAILVENFADSALTLSMKNFHYEGYLQGVGTEAFGATLALIGCDGMDLSLKIYGDCAMKALGIGCTALNGTGCNVTVSGNSLAKLLVEGGAGDYSCASDYDGGIGVMVSSLAISGGVTLETVGGNGDDGWTENVDKGMAGSKGGTGIVADSIEVQKGVLIARGGFGGNGATGAQGSNGKNATAVVGQAVTDGSDGGDGGDGGQGASAVKCTSLNIASGCSVYLYGGDGGNGGDGGKGGDGGQPWYVWASTNGGQGGDGGLGGAGAVAIQGNIVKQGAATVETEDGKKGEDGDKGNEGSGKHG